MLVKSVGLWKCQAVIWSGFVGGSNYGSVPTS